MGHEGPLAGKAGNLTNDAEHLVRGRRRLASHGVDSGHDERCRRNGDLRKREAIQAHSETRCGTSERVCVGDLSFPFPGIDLWLNLILEDSPDEVWIESGAALERSDPALDAIGVG